MIGGGDWSEERLIPDAVRAWQTGATLQIRRPGAIRPWQHVVEPLAGYLALVETLWALPGKAGAYNFGPDTRDAASVQTVVEFARRAHEDGQVIYGDGSQGPHEAGRLALEIVKARTTLGYVPRWTLEETVLRTIHWYSSQYGGDDARNLCEADITAYDAALQKNP